MTWYALEEIEEALGETKDLLLPFDLGTWSKLALIVLLTGSGFNMPNMGNSLSSQPGQYNQYDDYQGFGDGIDSMNIPESSTPVNTLQTDPNFSSLMTGLGVSSTVIIVLALVMLVIGIPLILLSSIFEFIFYQSLIDKDVKIRENFSRHFWKGMRYFGFQLIYAIAVLGILAAAVAAVMASNALLVVALLISLPVIFVMGIFASLTHDFILLKMMEEDKSLIQAWRSFWPTLKSEWKQVTVYLIVKFFIGIVVGISAAIVVIIATVIMVIPIIIFAVLFAMISEVLVLLPVLLGLIAWFVVILYISVPFRVYIYYFIVLVYHDLTA